MWIRRITRALLPPLVLAAAACGEHATEPQLQPERQFARPGADAGECASDPDMVVVTNPEELFDAMRDAQEGDVIAVEGIISTTYGAYTFVNGVTLTCASPGAGIVATPDWNPNIGFLLRIFAHDVTVKNLYLGGANTPRGPIYGEYNGTTRLAQDLTFTGNTVVCGPGECLFLAGVSGSLIADNHFVSNGGNTGVHVQGAGERLPDGSSPYPTDNTQVLRNTVTSVAPSPTWSGFGGIRVRDGSDLVVSENVVAGPWFNSLSPSEVRESTFSRNELGEAQDFGVFFSFNPNTAMSMSGNEFRHNRVSGAGEAGAYVTLACANIFLGNVFADIATDIGVWFDVASGVNLFLGNHNIVVDNGDYDCYGDEASDPNVITGPGLRLSDVKPGDFARYARDHDGQGEAALR